MKVTATATGFYGGGLKQPGDVFTLSSEKDFSKHWMARVDEAATAPVLRAAVVLPMPQVVPRPAPAAEPTAQAAPAAVTLGVSKPTA